MANNILFYFSWQLRPVHHGIVMEKLTSILTENPRATVYFLRCVGEMKPCYTNRTGDGMVCKICRLHSEAALSRFDDRVKVLNIAGESSEGLIESFEYNSVDDIKRLTYKGIKIGYGALSSYISFTRNLEPEFDEEFRTYLNALLDSEVRLTERLIELNNLYKFDHVIFFNGRTADTRPLYDFSLVNNIPFISLELIKKSDTDYYINDFYNCLPHDIDFHHKRMEVTWERSLLSMEERAAVGSKFFENRRKGVLVRDRKVYTANQVSDMLPGDWSADKRNISIFNSSEDEFASIGDIFEDKALFPSQEDGLKQLLDAFKHDDEFVFYFRIHPNLTNVNYSYHHRLYDLVHRYPNLRIVGPSEKVSTYAMIDASEKIIVFGSTTGVEACFWQKPVILLAGAFYYHLDATYKPRTLTELTHLIKTPNLPVKDRIEAVKYGYYMMSYNEYTRKNSFSPRQLRVLGVNLGLGHQHLRVLGSRTVFKIFDLTIRKLAVWFSSPTFKIPTNESKKPLIS